MLSKVFYKNLNKSLCSGFSKLIMAINKLFRNHPSVTGFPEISDTQLYLEFLEDKCLDPIIQLFYI